MILSPIEAFHNDHFFAVEIKMISCYLPFAVSQPGYACLRPNPRACCDGFGCGRRRCCDCGGARHGTRLRESRDSRWIVRSATCAESTSAKGGSLARTPRPRRTSAAARCRSSCSCSRCPENLLQGEFVSDDFQTFIHSIRQKYI